MRLSSGLLWALAIAAGLIGGALVPLIATADVGHDRGLWIALNLVIGWSFAGVGLFAWYRRPHNRVGPLMVATSFAWYLSVANMTDVPLLFSLGLWLSNLFVTTAIHLILSFPSGRLESRIDKGIVAYAYIVTTLGFVPAMLFFNPASWGATSARRTSSP